MIGWPCKAVVSGERCPGPAAYWAVIAGCEVCLTGHGFLFCPGHPLCVRHAAEVRAGVHVFDGASERGPVEVERIWSEAAPVLMGAVNPVV